jgi:hypothetical protein
MKTSDIKQIELALNVSLPDELAEKYTACLLDGIEEFPEIAGLLILKPNDIININQKLRRKGLWKKPFPEHFFVIGYEKNTFYLVDLREKPLRVFRVMNNNAWRYNPDYIENNLVCSVPNHEGLDSYIEILPSFHLQMKQKQKCSNELEIPKPEATGYAVCKIPEQMMDDTFDTIDRTQVLSGSLIEKFLTTEIDLSHMSIAYHETGTEETHYDSTPRNAITFASTGVDGCHFCVIPKKGEAIDESPVYKVSPMDGEDTIVWVAKDFIDFLSIGVAMGSFTYISCCHLCDKEELLELIEESWSECDEEKKKSSIELLKEHFPVREYNNLFKHIIGSYEDRNNHVELSFGAISDFYTEKLGHYNRG